MFFNCSYNIMVKTVLFGQGGGAMATILNKPLNVQFCACMCRILHAGLCSSGIMFKDDQISVVLQYPHS